MGDGAELENNGTVGPNSHKEAAIREEMREERILFWERSSWMIESRGRQEIQECSRPANTSNWDDTGTGPTKSSVQEKEGKSQEEG